MAKHWVIVSGPSHLSDGLVGQRVPFELEDEQGIRHQVQISITSVTGHTIGKAAAMFKGSLILNGVQVLVRSTYRARPSRGKSRGTIEPLNAVSPH